MLGRRALAWLAAVPVATACLGLAWTQTSGDTTPSGELSSARTVDASARPTPRIARAARPAVCMPTSVDALPRSVAVTRTERVVIGASVTQLTTRELRRQIAHVVIDARGGRSWAIRSTGDGPTLWQAYLAHRATMRAGDWLVMETARGDIPAAVNRTCLEAVKATLPHGACLAWVIPHEYYGEQTAAMRRWNADTAALIKTQLASYPCHAVIDWDALVNSYQARTKGLTAAERALGAPLLYDGRHPTALGRTVLAAAIKRATATR